MSRGGDYGSGKAVSQGQIATNRIDCYEQHRLRFESKHIKCLVQLAREMSAFPVVRVRDYAEHGLLLKGAMERVVKIQERLNGR